jgi:hypothetical protein
LFILILLIFDLVGVGGPWRIWTCCWFSDSWCFFWQWYCCLCVWDKYTYVRVRFTLEHLQKDTNYSKKFLVYRGLLSAHILAEYLQQRAGIMSWYRGELLSMAKDLGYRLMPAFNTTTGIPHGRVSFFFFSFRYETCLK